MPDMSKVRFQTKRDTGYTPRAEGGGSLQGRVCPSDEKRTRDGVTPEEDPAALKKAKLESATWEGPNIGPTACQGRGNCSRAIPGAGGVLSQ